MRVLPLALIVACIGNPIRQTHVVGFVLVLFKHFTKTLTVAQGPGGIRILVLDGDHTLFILVNVLKDLLTFGRGSLLLFEVCDAFCKGWHDVDIQIVVFDFRNQRAEVCHF